VNVDVLYGSASNESATRRQHDHIDEQTVSNEDVSVPKNGYGNIDSLGSPYSFVALTFRVTVLLLVDITMTLQITKLNNKLWQSIVRHNLLPF
jgi:hypothetical protein